MVPFVAFSHLVDIADIGKPAALLRAARASLGRDRQSDLLLIVDDTHDLDILSATLAYQLALAGTAADDRHRPGGRSPNAIAALWTDGLLDRIDVDTPGAATTTAEVDTFIAELPAPARAVLDYLAVEEPLSLADLTALADDSAVAEAQQWGAAETRLRDEHSDKPVVYTAHPLFSERARAALGADDQEVAWEASAATLCAARQGRFADGAAGAGRRAPPGCCGSPSAWATSRPCR
nr:hypothetical protein [Mycobacterium tilburgii]